MSKPIVWVEWTDKLKQNHHVPIVTFSNNLENAIILHKKEFVIVSLKEIRFVRWHE